MKQTIRINEDKLKRIVSESVKKILKEGADTELIKATTDFYSATKRLRNAFASSDAAYIINDNETWETFLSKLLVDTEQFLKHNW